MLLTPWQVNDSAAAKMVQIGGSALTNSELISVAVGITPDQAKQLLSLAGNDLHALAKIRSSADAFKIVGPILADLPYEEFWIIRLYPVRRTFRWLMII